MAGGGDDEVEDVGWQTVGGALRMVEPGAVARDGREPEVVATSNGECVAVPRCAPEPKTPSLHVVASNNLTHLPYAAWCPHRVAARHANHPLTSGEMNTSAA